MFEEFDPRVQRTEKRRMGASLAISSLVYLGIAGGVVAASAAARQAVKEDELVQIQFAQPPEPAKVEPEPPPPEPTPPTPTEAPRPKTKRKELTPPKEVPKDKPAESDKPLADAPADDGKDGFTDGVAGGTGKAAAPAPTPPPPPAAPSGPVHLPEKATPPQLKSGSASPAYPEAARKAGVQGMVVARVTIAKDGKVTNVEILKGPEVFHEAVKAALARWQYEPARLPDGTPIAVFRIVPVPFKLENM